MVAPVVRRRMVNKARPKGLRFATAALPLCRPAKKAGNISSHCKLLPRAVVHSADMESIIYAGQMPKARDEAAAELEDIDGLVNAYRSRMYRYALLSLRDPDLADSIANDCLLKAHRARAQFRGDCTVATWLTRIATNLIRDQVRSRKLQFWKSATESSADPSEVLSRIHTPGLSPEASLLMREKIASLWQTVETLSPRQRNVFVLRFVEELELAEIAVALHMNVSTVKSHLHRALSTLRSALEKTR